jgi:hypothetical protein
MSEKFNLEQRARELFPSREWTYTEVGARMLALQLAREAQRATAREIAEEIAKDRRAQPNETAIEVSVRCGMERATDDPAREEAEGGAGVKFRVYTARWQPLTLLVDDTTDPPMVSEAAPRSLYPCHECGRRRWAEYLEAQVFYDCARIRCKAGHGCAKHPITRKPARARRKSK